MNFGGDLEGGVAACEREREVKAAAARKKGQNI